MEQAVITSKRCRSVSQQAARRALSNRALKPRSARLPWCPLADPLKPCSAIDCGAPAWPLSSHLKSRSATGCVSAVSTRLCLAAGGCLGLIPTSPERSILQQTESKPNGVLGEHSLREKKGSCGWGEGERSLQSQRKNRHLSPRQDLISLDRGGEPRAVAERRQQPCAPVRLTQK